MNKQVTFYAGGNAPLVPTKGTDGNLCVVLPHIGQVRCENVAPQKQSFKEFRCDKPQGHKGPCLSYERTLVGLDTTRFCVWESRKVKAEATTFGL